MGFADAVSVEPELPGRWERDRARAWYDSVLWPLGCNYVPSTAVNQLEMWQEPTFDPETIDRELAWAADLGFTTVRIFLHDLMWREDRDGLLQRLDQVLGLAWSHGISTMPIFLDGVWNNFSYSGPQADPIPGIHNSRWVQSPNPKVVVAPEEWDPLRDYIQTIIDIHRDDERILLWDLYNEPGNEGMVDNAIPLVEATFRWAREVAPSQPLTAGVWNYHERFSQLNSVQLAASDIATFHWYGDLDTTTQLVDALELRGRPIMCTEYMARPMGSRFETHLRLFHERRVGAVHWGLVQGRTQTHLAWTSTYGEEEPEEWFHDVLRPDGSVYEQSEADLFRELSPRRARSGAGSG